MQHRIEVLPAALDYVGTCSCGWIGKDQPSFNAAKREAGTHKVNAIRADQKTPKP